MIAATLTIGECYSKTRIIADHRDHHGTRIDADRHGTRIIPGGGSRIDADHREYCQSEIEANRMRSRGARLTLLVLFAVTLLTTAFLYWKGESLARAETAALRSFEDQAREGSRALLDMRAAQQAYVAQGQAGEFWPGKVAAGIDSLRGTLAALRSIAASPSTSVEIDSALKTLDDFRQLDRRARGYTGSGQNLLASDLIFGDGLQMTQVIDSKIDQARAGEVAARTAASSTHRTRQAFALAAAAAAATLVVLLLLPQREPDQLPVPAVAAPVQTLGLTTPAALDPPMNPEIESWSPPKRLTVVPRPEPVAAAAGPTPEREAAPATSEPPQMAAHTDFSGVALLCTDLARVIDTQQLPSLLDRASSLLDAKGIILWISDPDGRELNPIVAHGYAPQLVDRLGTISRDAENATAAAFRTSLLQTVQGATGSNGAIAAPLVTPAGCVGVMAAEVRHEGEREESRLAAAAIVAAQLATLVGPPVKTRAEAAGA